MSKLFIACAVLMIMVSANVDDPDFVEKFKVRINERGTFTEYPKKGDNVKVHYTVN